VRLFGVRLTRASFDKLRTSLSNPLMVSLSNQVRVSV
jgi:hypothetical protein